MSDDVQFTPAPSLEDLAYSKLQAEEQEAWLRADKYAAEAEERRTSATAARIFTFAAPIDRLSTRAAMHTVDEWLRRDSERPIEMILNSEGGSVIDGLGFYDFLAHVGTRVDLTIRVCGMAASMAGIILQAATHRVMSKHSLLMIHEVSNDYMGGQLSEMEDDVKFMTDLQNRMLKILADRSKLSVAQIKKHSARKDWWLPAATAKRHGFVDAVE